MSEAEKCPQCGTPLSPGALAGLCPACLLKAGAADTATGVKPPPFDPPTVGELAGRFPQLEILELIGKGGMGAVYKARQKQLDRFVALKILPPGIGSDAAFAERFAREARALAKLNHPNIVTLYEFGETDGQFHFLMELVDGVNLRQLLDHGRVSAREALAIVPQICDALQFAHDQGIVHRDIKPENILLDRLGRVKVADFGLAKIIGRDTLDTTLPGPTSAAGSTALTDAGKIMGTPQYMSPEQKENPGEVDHRADIYALGVVFYQMLTGELPGKKIEPPSKKVRIDVRLDEIVLRALEQQPELRYQQASVLKTQIETIAQDRPTRKTPVFLRVKALGYAGWALIVVLVVTAIAFLGLLAENLISHFNRAPGNPSAGIPQTMGAAPEDGASTAFYIGQAHFPRGDSIEITSVDRTESQMTVKGRYYLVSAGSATLALYITSTNQPDFPQSTGQSLHILKGRGDFELSRSNLMPGLPHVSMYAAGHPFADLYFGNREETAEEGRLDLQEVQSFPAASLAEPPKLQFLAWQDEWKINQASAARHPDGSPVTNETELKWLKRIPSIGSDVTAMHLSPEPRFLNLWFSHPAFDANSLCDVTLLDSGNKVIVPGANGTASGSETDGNQYDGTPGWYAKNLSPGAGTNVPLRVTVQLRYTLGPLERTQEIVLRPEHQISTTLEGESLLNGIGQNLDGQSFVSIAVNSVTLKSRKFGVMAVTKDGRHIMTGAGESGFADGSGASIVEFNFNIPLSNISKFIIGTRPIRTNDWKNVVLPPRLLNSTDNDNSSQGTGGQILSGQPPVVVETSPISGARNVDPGETEIRVRFSKPMQDGSWSWSTAWENSTPDFIGQPHYEADGKTCVAKVKLEPGRTYGFWLNSENFQNFRDTDGRPAVPYLLIFQVRHQ